MDNEVVGVKTSFQRCAVDDKQRFCVSRCIIPVSIAVGLPIFENFYFEEIMSLINRSFKECTILLDDVIQKYTKQISQPHISLEEWDDIMIEEGDKWLERNRSAYEQLTIPYKIIRWSDWYKHPQYKTCCEEVERLYQGDESYRQMIHDTIEEFLARHTTYMNIQKYDKEQAFNNCLLYLKEECSVMCLWGIDGYDFEVYPSGRNKAMLSTYNKLIEPKNPGKLKSVSIRFKRYYRESNVSESSISCGDTICNSTTSRVQDTPTPLSCEGGSRS